MENIVNPLVSIVIVNYNGGLFLIKCLRAVMASTYRPIEIIVVDNGSQDNSILKAQEIFANERVRFIYLNKNYGPSYARNRGIEIATGRYVAFLDNDTEPTEAWLNGSIRMMENDPRIGVCQCKLLLRNAPDRLDYVGDYLSPYGFLIQEAETGEQDRGQYDFHKEVFSAKSAAMIARKSSLKKADGFDEDYFIYVEETDLCWRIWLAGYRIVFAFESCVYHAFGGSALSLREKQNYFAKFHGTKNYITTLIKNLGTASIIKILPIHIFLWLGIAFWLILHKRDSDAHNILKGICWVLRHMRHILKKRHKVQSGRVVSDRELFPRIIKKEGFDYFYRKLARPQKVGVAEAFYRHKD